MLKMNMKTTQIGCKIPRIGQYLDYAMLGLCSLALVACNSGSGGGTSASKGQLNIVPDSVKVTTGNSVAVPFELVGGSGGVNQTVTFRVSDPSIAQVSPSTCVVSSGTQPISGCMLTVTGKKTGSIELIAESSGYANDQAPMTVDTGNGVGTISIVNYSTNPTFNYYQSAPVVPFQFTVQFTPAVSGQTVYGSNPISVQFTDTSNGQVTYSPNTVCGVTTQNPTCVISGWFKAGSVPSNGFTINASVTGSWQAGGQPFNGQPPIPINMTPVSTQGSGSISVASQNASNLIYSGSKAPLFVNLTGSTLTNGSYTVSLSTQSNTVFFYDYPAGTNTGMPTFSTTKQCKLVVDNSTYANYQANTISGCGFNLWANPYGLDISSGATAPISVTVLQTPNTILLPATASLPTYNSVINLSLALPSSAPVKSRTVTFTNNSSNYVVFAANSGTANAYVSPVTSAGAGVVSCGASAPSQACPIGSTCVQGGQNVGNSTPYQCFWDAPTFSNNTVAPNASTTVTVPSYAGITSGTQQIQWSGSYYALNCPSGSSSAGCPAAPTTPGTSPSNQAQTIAEVTYQHNAVDFYDVSVINGVTNSLAFGPSSTSGKSAGSPIPGGSGSITTPYACGTAGLSQAQTGTGAASSAYTLPASNWSFAPTTLNLPTQPTGTASTSPASYFAVVSPSNPSSPTSCTSQSICSGSATGDTVCGWNSNNLSGANAQVCGSFQEWASANTLWGWNAQANNAGNPVFNFTTQNASGVTVGQLQLCDNPPAGTIYSSYATNPPSTDPGLACGGTNWSQTNTNLATPTAPITVPATNYTTQNPTWVSYVYPSISWLKMACPTCYTYPYDDQSSTFNCEKGLNEQGTNTLDYTLQVGNISNTFN